MIKVGNRIEVFSFSNIDTEPIENKLYGIVVGYRGPEYTIRLFLPNEDTIDHYDFTFPSYMVREI